MKDWRVCVASIAGVVIIACTALIMGQDGLVVALSIGACCSLGGVAAPALVEKLIKK